MPGLIGLPMRSKHSVNRACGKRRQRLKATWLVVSGGKQAEACSNPPNFILTDNSG